MVIKLPDGLRCVECPQPVRGQSFVYMLYCRNGSYYVGQSHDIHERLLWHQQGMGARHTRQMKDFVLIYTEGPMSGQVALLRERQLKRWSRAKKFALASGNLSLLRALSQSRE
ncbi:GIY-YIG nuclease family protein [Coraliomargarita parva]|uniref:GIY-YIG nuclease family protein n=1 Tax=Coraliomargarita parva TaxID=3014050 RepID=UPI0022B42987|nr:GIY-YIG nuclease family protein [Coraliomargarita parva]